MFYYTLILILLLYKEKELFISQNNIMLGINYIEFFNFFIVFFFFN